MTPLPYDDDFFRARAPGSFESARKILPFVLELIGCRSVVDIGCGLGSWLSVLRGLGIPDIRGLDGSYIRKEDLLIPAKNFFAANLASPLEIDREFDLALCLEVAEHLPSERNESLVKELAAASPVVLFSASLPHQDGTGHINEQWLEYWVDIFAGYGYGAIDCIRAKFWNDPSVDWWYKQNAILYVRTSALSDYPKLAALPNSPFPPVSIIHPEFLLHKQRRLEMPLAELVPMTLGRINRALASRLGRRSSSGGNRP